MDISIIIVSYNTKDILFESLTSLTHSFQGDLSYEIIVVDNGSQDGSLTMIEDNFPMFKVIRNKQNLGYTKAMNQGLQIAQGDYLVQLNPDVIIQPETFEKLFDWMRNNKEVGICTPKVINRDGTLQKQCRRSFARPWDVISYFLGLDKLFPDSKFFGRYLKTFLDEDHVAEVEAVSGSCMFIRRTVIDEIGFLDERFFAYQEDADFCFRAKVAGWKIKYLPFASVIHYGGQGGSKNEPYKAIRTWHHSYYLYYKKNLAQDYFFVINWIMYAAMAVKYIISIVATFFKRDKIVGTKKP